MIDILITNKTRIRLLTRFFLNSNAKAHLRGLAGEFGESTNAIRLELNRFEKAGLLTSSQEGIKKVFQANTRHPFFEDIHRILLKHHGFDHIIRKVINGLGTLKQVFITGDFARGNDGGPISLLFIAGEINRDYLRSLVAKAEQIISNRIEYRICTEAEAIKILSGLNEEEYLLLWEDDGSDKENESER